ncbi:MAG: UDP-N-acetylmuramoyl-L-alanine--D-glutamate ligase [Candidatus Moraniibacteriota bacterium]
MISKNTSFKKFIQNIKGKKIIIWGLGLNQGGLEAAKYFARTGAKVVVVDLKKSRELTKSIAELKKFSNIKFIFGRQNEFIFSGTDLIIKNPAIPWDLPLTKKLLKKGYQIETDITLFFRFFRGKIIGVTGSKGKTTTATLISQFLEQGSKNVLLGGNIRVSLFSFLKGVYLNDRKKIAVLELSSFQLEDLDFIKRSPYVAVVTNILRDHLNRYGNYKKYITAKKNICLFQGKGDNLVLNRDDKKLKEFTGCSRVKTLWFSPVLSSPGERSETRGSRNTKAKYLDSRLRGNDKRAVGTIIKNPVFLSKNNQANLAAALAVAKIFKVKQSIVNKVANNFKGVPYRMEKIAVIKNLPGRQAGITFYNDTTATIPDAAIGGINTIAAQGKSKIIILISGGADKNLKFEKFAKIIAKKVKKIIFLPGTATPLIEKALTRHAPHVPRDKASSMDKAVKTAYKSAESGDTILLSPGCASFGLFKNEFDRGDQFNEAVKKLE